jgi:chaperonin cofactor prefoldin
MSKRAKVIAKLKEYIRNLVVKELDEASTTASAGAANPMGTGIYYDTPYAFRSKRKKDKKKRKKIATAGGYKPVNESQPFADFTQFPKLSRAQQESLDELFGFAESYQIYNAFEKDPKKFIKTLDDMANIRKASNKKPKGVNFNKGKKQFVKETVKKEVDAVNKVLQNLKKLRQDYIKIYNMGDKTLKAKHFNKYYEIFLNAEKEITTLHRTLDAHQRSTAMLDNINEGRYHDWRNDESMTPKQKIGRSMREIRDALNELDKTVKMNLKLKTELKMKSEDYWKNTHKALTKISERLVKMANKVGNLK